MRGFGSIERYIPGITSKPSDSQKNVYNFTAISELNMFPNKLAQHIVYPIIKCYTDVLC